MKKLLIPSLSIGLLAKTILVGHALAFTLYVDNELRAPADTTYENGGINTTNNLYNNQFIPNGGDNGVSGSYTTPSVVNFGETTTNGVPNGTGTFSGGASSTRTFAFDLQNGSHSPTLNPGDTGDPNAADDAFDRFVVTGTLTGSVSDGPTGPASTTKITFSSIVNEDATGTQQTTSTLAINPNNGLMAQFIVANIGGQTYNIYINAIQDIPAPGTPNLTISGFITTAGVPEPGSMALLLGLGVSGVTLLRRRKK